MRGCYLYWKNLGKSGVNLSGVDRKILAQMSALRSYGLDLQLLPYRRTESPFGVALSCLPGMRDGNDWPDAEILADFDFIYVRRPRYLSKELIKRLKQVKAINPSSKRVIEFPTYPYWDRLGGDPLRRLMRLKDRRGVTRLLQACDAVAIVFAKQPEHLDLSVFEGIKIKRIYNGVELDTVRIKSPVSNFEEINVCCAALFARWHGIDRFIEGLRLYYDNGGERIVNLHLMGDGSEVSNLKTLVHRNSLDDRVWFYGYCTREQMDGVYDRCSLAIESLGLHRVDAEVVTAIKLSEYLGKGIPFLYEGELAFPTNAVPKWAFSVASDDSPIDMDEVITFHDELYAAQVQEEIISDMRAFAEANATTREAMRSVGEYLLT